MIYRNKRCEMEILAQILSSAQIEVKKTRLMYQSNLCYPQFLDYFDFLLKKELLTVKKGNPNGEVYMITDKGKEFFETIKTVFSKIE